MASVFLSYDHEDAALARPLADALEKAGHKVWYDRHIHGGAQYSRKIEQALDAADAVVVLWSPRSLESAWVRDEAAEGRDRGKLVPLSVGGVTAPMGFRQFQTIDLGAWKGRGKMPRLQELLNAVQNQSAGGDIGTAEGPVGTRPAAASSPRPRSRAMLAAIAAVLVLLIAGGAAWLWLGRSSLPIVQVAAANSSARSQAAASDLFVKLGSLAQVGEGKWQLVDTASASRKPDLIFRTADVGSPGEAQANLVLLDGKDSALLWSREFTAPAGREADLRQQLSFTAGRVLGCALESREAGGLPRDLLKLFLNTCAAMAETSMDEPSKAADPLRQIVAAKPRFSPAWARLLYAGTGVVDAIRNSGGGDVTRAISDLRADMEAARKIDPELPELLLAEVYLLPPTAYGRRLALLKEAAQRAPDHGAVFADQNSAFQGVGRMWDAVRAARRAAELDPLSPAQTTTLILTLAYAGQVDAARQELARAERLWARTGSLRDAQWAFHLRFGDPTTAKSLAPFDAPALDYYLAARADPSPANVEKFTSQVQPQRTTGEMEFSGWAFQGLGEFNQVEPMMAWIAQVPTEAIARESYLLFRPALASFRRDPRFMAIAKRIGLLDYWRTSGRWPDFCSDPRLPYNCKAEAAKYG